MLCGMRCTLVCRAALISLFPYSLIPLFPYFLISLFPYSLIFPIVVILDKIQFSYTKGFPALSDVSARIEPGIHLLAGENGAGKTTLLRVLSGVVIPSSGRCSVYGSEPGCDIPSERGKTFLIEDNMEFPGKTIHDFAKMHSRFYPSFSPLLMAENLKAFGLSGFEPMKNLSYGNKKKTQIAYALALGVELLLLDEPTNGLDIESKAILKSILARSVKDNQTVVIATHTVADLENLFEGAIMMQGSKILFAGLEEDVVSRLAFTVTSSPQPGVLYSETNLGKYLNISEAEGDETRIDWRLFYSALHSEKRDDLLTVLNPNPPLEND